MTLLGLLSCCPFLPKVLFLPKVPPTLPFLLGIGSCLHDLPRLFMIVLLQSTSIKKTSLTLARSCSWKKRVLAPSQSLLNGHSLGQGSQRLCFGTIKLHACTHKVPNLNQPSQKSLTPHHIMFFCKLRRLSNDKDSVMISGSGSSAGCEGPGSPSSLAGHTELVLACLFCKGATAAAGCGCPCGWNLFVPFVCSTTALSTFPSDCRWFCLDSAPDLCGKFQGSYTR